VQLRYVTFTLRFAMFCSSTFFYSIERTVHPTLSHINKFTVDPNTLSPIYRWSADYSQPYSDSFGNFLRRVECALASAFLYAVESDMRQMKQCWLLNEVLKHF
jgi:hypothetical protein